MRNSQERGSFLVNQEKVLPQIQIVYDDVAPEECPFSIDVEKFCNALSAIGRESSKL